MRLTTSNIVTSDCSFVQAVNLPSHKLPLRRISEGVSYFLHRNSKLIALQMNVWRFLTFVDTQVRDGILNFAWKVPGRFTKPATGEASVTPSTVQIGSFREYSVISSGQSYKKSGEKTQGYFACSLFL